MTQTFNENVVIDGAADVTQLTVQGNGTQNAPLQVWEDSAGNDFGRVTGDGRLQMGDYSLSTNESRIEAHHQGTSSSVIKRGLNTLGRFTGAISNGLAWLVSELELPGTGTLSSVHAALRGKLTHSNTGGSANADLRGGDFEAINQSGTSGTPVGQMTAVQGRVDNQANAYLTKARGVAGQITNASGADIETAAALEVLPPVNSGTIDTLIGLEIPNITQGTDNYAIRTGSGKVKLGVVNNGLVKSVGSELANAVKGTDHDIPMVGSNGTVAGQAGIVPQPAATDNTKFLRGDGTWAVVSTVGALGDLTDVDTTGASNGDVLTYDGSEWTPQAPAPGDLIPVGVMLPYGGASAPSNWLLCDGTAVSRTTYAALLSAIGDIYKRFTTLATRTSDSAGTTDLGYSTHGITAGNATLTLRFTPAPAIISAVNTTSDVITTSAAHLLETGDKVRVSSTGTLPGGLVAGTDYYVRVVSATTLTLHPTLADAQANTNIINLTSAGTGTRTITPQAEVARTGMAVDSVAGSVLTLSGGSGHILPAAGTAISVECASGLFFLPDMRGRVGVGAGQGAGLTNRVLGTAFGEENHQLTVAELASHGHTAGSISARTPGNNGTNTSSAGSSSTGGGSYTIPTSGNTGANGSNTPHNNMQPSLVMNYIIKT